MSNKILPKFLTLIESDLKEFKSIGLSGRYAIIDSYGNEELQDLANEFSLTAPELRTRLNQAAKDLDEKTDLHKDEKKKPRPHIEEHKKSDDKKGHKVHKASEEDKKIIHRFIRPPKPPIEHNERTNHTDKKKPRPPKPPKPPTELPPLTIDDVTIVATYKYKK